MTQFITGTFFEAEPANRALGEIIATGRPRDDISIIMNGETYHRFWDEVASGETTGSNAAGTAGHAANAGNEGTRRAASSRA